MKNLIVLIILIVVVIVLSDYDRVIVNTISYHSVGSFPANCITESLQGEEYFSDLIYDEDHVSFTLLETNGVVSVDSLKGNSSFFELTVENSLKDVDKAWLDSYVSVLSKECQLDSSAYSDADIYPYTKTTEEGDSFSFKVGFNIEF